MPKPDPLQDIINAMAAHTLTEDELRILAMLALGQAAELIELRHYATARQAIADAIGHLDALRGTAGRLFVDPRDPQGEHDDV